MFARTRNIENSFQSIRLFCGVTILGAFVFSGYVYYDSGRKLKEAESRIYILAAGKAMEAFSGDRKENIPVEAKDHIRAFHLDFFTLDHDEKQIRANITRALYLVDESARRIYENLKESGYYANIISANVSQEISIDSISLDTRTYPFYFRCYATQQVIRTTSIATRDLVTEGWLRTVSRSENNSHGFLIERWAILENKDIKVEQR